jgi:photosynthetic reaction center cytochrome c subunit
MTSRFPPTLARRRLVLLLILVGAALFVHVSAAQSTENRPARQEHPASVLPVEPTGASRCQFCHASEVEGYSQSAMAHSLRRAGNEPAGIVNANGSRITMHSSSTGFWQKWENAGDTVEYHIEWVIGSGSHAQGYLLSLGGHLFQSPVAYYTSRQSYDLAPGYENQPDPDFTRPVPEECVLCHSGTALHVPGSLNQYRSPVFADEGITCERCHGPSEQHLADPRPGTIINPAKLAPPARDSVCEQCHLFGVARVANPGKKLSDFVPGQGLENTFTIYHDANPTGAFKVISQVEQLALSACARKSAGQLWCGTCHNPHGKLEQSVDFYRARCLSCHTGSFSRSHPPKDSNCVACHMPRRAAKDGGHSAFTDHRIQRRPGEQPELPSTGAIVAWREPAPDLRERNLGIAEIEAGMQRHSPQLIGNGYRELTEVQEQFSNDSDFFKWIGEALLVAKQNSEAEIAFERGLQLDPNSALAEARAAAPYMQEGNVDEAITHLQRAIALDPLNLSAARTLMDLYRKQGQSTEASELAAKIKAQLNSMPARDETTTSGSAQSAEAAFKNIQVLKGIPSSELIPAMEFIASSLGVKCTFCHVEGHFEKDDKKQKQTAREMMRMMFSLNNASFAQQRAVTCYTCHRGAVKPVAIPMVANEAPSPQKIASEPQPTSADLPTVRQILDRYVSALGGAEAVGKIFSRVEKADFESGNETTSVEIFTAGPEKQAVIRHLPMGDALSVFDGQAGWVSFPGRPTRSMDDGEVAGASMDADLQFPLHIQELFPELSIQYPEKISGRDAYVLLGARKGEPPVKLCFDAQSGLLVRVVRYTQSPLGLDPTRIDYGDYREVDGVEVPFRITTAEPESVVTVQVQNVQQNVAIDETRFAKPAAGN